MDRGGDRSLRQKERKTKKNSREKRVREKGTTEI